MKQLLYNILAPVLRNVFANKMTSKPIVGIDARLYYNVGQHLGFFGKKRINYEPEYRSVISGIVKPGNIVFDIGANIGQYSVVLSRMVGPQGRVISLEPDSDNLANLLLNLDNNKCNNVLTLQNAVGGEEGTLVFYKDTVTGGRMGSLIKSNTGNTFKGKTEEVKVTTLSNLIDSYGIPNFMKIDVEGAEAEVLKVLDLRLEKTIFFVEVRKETKQRIFEIFKEKGRSICLIENGEYPIHSGNEIPDYANLIIK